MQDTALRCAGQIPDTTQTSVSTVPSPSTCQLPLLYRSLPFRLPGGACLGFVGYDTLPPVDVYESGPLASSTGGLVRPTIYSYVTLGWVGGKTDP